MPRQSEYTHIRPILRSASVEGKLNQMKVNGNDIAPVRRHGALTARAAVVGVVCLAAEYALLHALAAHLAAAGAALRGPGGLHALAAVITAAAAVLLVLAWTWLSCGALLTAADVLRSGAATRRRLAVPLGWHRLVAALLGTGALCLPTAVRADAPGEGSGRNDPGRAAAVIDGLPLPDRPRGTGHRRPPRSGTLQVATGDSLWSLSSAHLGARAPDARVAATWPRWYSVNRAQIGPDPDLLIPGTTLRIPTSPPAREPDRDRRTARTQHLQHPTENRSAGNDGGQP